MGRRIIVSVVVVVVVVVVVEGGGEEGKEERREGQRSDLVQRPSSVLTILAKSSLNVFPYVLVFIGLPNRQNGDGATYNVEDSTIGFLIQELWDFSAVKFRLRRTWRRLRAHFR